MATVITVPTLWLFALIVLPVWFAIGMIIHMLLETFVAPLVRRRFAPKSSLYDWDEDDEEMDNEDVGE